MFEALINAPRLLLKQPLTPVQGDRFQPTGFADLGPAVYQGADGTRMLLVESVQSVANRLEATCLDGSGPEVDPELLGLPYVRVRLTGAAESVTSSLIEAHRINSPFIITDEKFKTEFLKKSEYAKGRPIHWGRIAGTIFHYDPNSVLHGVFMANLEDGRVRLPRAVSGFIEAAGASEAVSGGVKNNPLDPSGKIRVDNWDKDVYGNVPYARTEYIAKDLAAYFNIDLSLVNGYRLPEPASRLLVALALLKIRRFLSRGLRLRTACDLTPLGKTQVQAPAGFDVPEEADLLRAVQGAIGQCRGQGLIADPPVTELTRVCVEKATKAEQQSKG